MGFNLHDHCAYNIVWILHKLCTCMCRSDMAFHHLLCGSLTLGMTETCIRDLTGGISNSRGETVPPVECSQDPAIKCLVKQYHITKLF